MSYGANKFDTVARQMLRPQSWRDWELTASLYDLLDRADDLCDAWGGELESREVVAAVIALWQLLYPTTSPVRFKNEPSAN